jgi:hypothetical protein
VVALERVSGVCKNSDDSERHTGSLCFQHKVHDEHKSLFAGLLSNVVDGGNQAAKAPVPAPGARSRQANKVSNVPTLITDRLFQVGEP